MAMEKKIMPLIVLDSDDPATANDQGIVETVFAVFGNIDEGDDIMHIGSFTKTFRERGTKVRILDQHNTDSIMRALGTPMELKELSRAELPQQVLDVYPDAAGGAYAKIQFLMNTPEGAGAFERIKAGAVDEWSFGYDAVDSDHEQQNGRRIRHLRQVKLYELGPVLWGMNQATTTVSAKAADDPSSEPEVKRVVPYQDIPLLARARRWDATAARRRVRSWAGYDPDDEDAMNWSMYRRAHMWYDQDEPEALASYKLPYADVVRGRLMAVPRGIFAVAGVLQGARGGAEMPEADQERLRTLVSRWYARMREEFDDENLVPAWEKAGPIAFLTPDEQEHDGEDKGPLPDIEYKGVNLSEYVRQIASTFYAEFPDTIPQDRDGPRVVYYCEEVWDVFLVVRQEGNQEENGLWRANYSVTEDGIEFAAREDWQQGHRPFVLLAPAGMQVGSEVVDAEGKVGRMLSQHNADRLANVMTELTNILVEAGYIDAPDEEEDGDDQPEESVGTGPPEAPIPAQADEKDMSPAPDPLSVIESERADISYVLVGH